MPTITPPVHHDVGPPVQSFPVGELENHVRFDEKNRVRKPAVNLDECKLMQMVQYNCKVVKETKEVECRPLLRLFRQCQGALTVETTEWEYMRS